MVGAGVFGFPGCDVGLVSGDQAAPSELKSNQNIYHGGTEKLPKMPELPKSPKLKIEARKR